MTRSGDTFRSLPRPAQRFFAAVAACTVAGLVVASSATAVHQPSWWLVALLVGLCAAGAAFEMFAPGDYALQPNYIAFFWGALVLPPWAIVLLAAACFVPGWALGREPGHKTLFNVLNYVLAGLVTSALAGIGELSAPGMDLRAVAAVIAAATLSILVNHLLIIVVVAYAAQQPLYARVPQLTDGLPLSVGVALTGGVLAALWEVAPDAALIAVGPVALVYRALAVPMLRHQADTDAKTGLYHSERFREELTAQLESAARRSGGRSRLAVAMVDLDHLRQINTRCGHLAGDTAIRAVADELAELASRHGAAGRFGGEEFSLVLPGFDAQATKQALDDIRLRLRAVDLGEADLRVSFSAGVAVFPDHGTEVDDLLAAADAALYDAKGAGRAQVRIALSPASREALELSVPAPVAQPPQPRPATATGRLPRMRRGAGRRASDRLPEELERQLDDSRALLVRMQRSQLETMVGLARAMEDKDPFRNGSTERVASIAVAIATELGFPKPELRAVALGAVLRDIGTVGVRDATLLKHGRLDPVERDEVRRHTEVASRVLSNLELPVIVKQVVRSHHEHWDGSGYPDGLAGNDIPLAARIVSVADALDAMLSPRPWRPALGALAAHAEIAAGAGRQFCPEVAGALARTTGDPGWTATVAEDRERSVVTEALTLLRQ
jgi:diguanylate cyclase (GGDEF)-like protein